MCGLKIHVSLLLAALILLMWFIQVYFVVVFSNLCVCCVGKLIFNGVSR